MRTYTGKVVDEEKALKDGFTGSVSEKAFDLDKVFLAAWERDMRKYHAGVVAEPVVEEPAVTEVEPIIEAEPVVEVQPEVVEEPVVEEPVVEVQPEVVEEPAVIEAADINKPKYVPSPTFVEKMMRSAEVLQDRYDELKNYALRFKKLKSRISKKFDSINQGRLQFVKLSVAGKTLKLYLNMDIKDTDPKFHCKDMSDKKTYVTVPVLLRIKSGRAVKYAKLLIDQCAEMHGLKENPKFVEVDAMALVEEFMNKPTEGDEAAATEA